MPDFRPDNSGLTLNERKVIQSRLAAHGFDPGPMDGIIGARTSAAIVAFKRAMGLLARPYVGPQTYDLLLADPKPLPWADLPPWITEGMRIMGWHERAQNAELRAWLKSDGHALGDPARYPWCGDFVETAIRLALPNEPMQPLKGNPYWALNWRNFGVPCGPLVGAVVSIRRDGGGHVGFAVAHDGSRIYVLGGNQSNTVSVSPIEAGRFETVSWRWPSTYPLGKPLPWRSSAAAAVAEFA